MFRVLQSRVPLLPTSPAARCATLFLAESQKRARPKTGLGGPGPGTRKISKNHEKTCWSMSMVPDRSVPGPVKKSPRPPGRPVQDPADLAELIRFSNEIVRKHVFPDFCSWIQVQILHFLRKTRIFAVRDTFFRRVAEQGPAQGRLGAARARDPKFFKNREKNSQCVFFCGDR